MIKLLKEIVSFNKTNILLISMSSVPVYLCYVKEDDSAHISVGINIKTLCNSEDIVSVCPVEKPMNTSENLCEKCLQKFEIVKNNIIIEPVIKCDRCSHNYTSHESRCVNSMSENNVPVCKPCYEEIKNDKMSGVETEYSNAEPWKESTGDRTFQITEELKNKFDEIENEN